MNHMPATSQPFLSPISHSLFPSSQSIKANDKHSNNQPLKKTEKSKNYIYDFPKRQECLDPCVHPSHLHTHIPQQRNQKSALPPLLTPSTYSVSSLSLPLSSHPYRLLAKTLYCPPAPAHTTSTSLTAVFSITVGSSTSSSVPSPVW